MISYVTTVGAACLILMWSVFNIWLNVLQFFAANAKQADVVLQTGEAEPVWWITCLMVFLTAVVPFLLGLFLLFKTVKSSARKTR